MLSMGQRTADFLLHWRWQVIVVYVALTAFFGVGVVKIAHSFQAQTSVSDLIPAHNRVTDVFKRYQSFSKPATVEILLKVKQGTIYTPQTLARIWRITRNLDLVPGIDHVTLTSIASEKVRVIRPTPPGLSSEPVMTNKIPATQAEAAAVQERARHAAGVTGILVSPDEKATLIEAAFFEHDLDYADVFQRVHEMLAAESDPNIEFYHGRARDADRVGLPLRPSGAVDFPALARAHHPGPRRLHAEPRRRADADHRRRRFDHLGPRRGRMDGAQPRTAHRGGAGAADGAGAQPLAADHAALLRNSLRDPRARGRRGGRAGLDVRAGLSRDHVRRRRALHDLPRADSDNPEARRAVRHLVAADHSFGGDAHAGAAGDPAAAQGRKRLHHPRGSFAQHAADRTGAADAGRAADAADADRHDRDRDTGRRR